jgi:hypothetical protein
MALALVHLGIHILLTLWYVAAEQQLLAHSLLLFS